MNKWKHAANQPKSIGCVTTGIYLEQPVVGRLPYNFCVSTQWPRQLLQCKLSITVQNGSIFSCRATLCLVVSVCLFVPNFVPNFCPRFINEALQLLLDSGLFLSTCDIYLSSLDSRLGTEFWPLAHYFVKDIWYSIDTLVFTSMSATLFDNGVRFAR